MSLKCWILPRSEDIWEESETRRFRPSHHTNLKLLFGRIFNFTLVFFSGNRFLFGLGFVNSWSILDINIYICCHECPLKFFILIIAHSEIFKIVCNSKIPSHEFRFHEIFDIKSWPISGYDIGIFVKILQFRLVYLWIHGQFWILILQFVAMNGECPQKFHFLFNFQNRALKSWSSKTMSSKFL